MQRKLFSIITVCFNSEKTIERTLKSVLAQTETDFEYIIVDGGSTDGTLDIIKKYEPLFEGKMSYTSEPDKGIYDAMNKGIKRANGKLIGILNSDDYYEENALESIRNAYEDDDLLIIYGMLRRVSGDKEISVDLKSHKLIEKDMINHPSCFISKGVYDKHGMYSLEYPYSADYEFMLRIRNDDSIKYKEVYKIITNFTVDGASGSVRGYMDTLRLKHNYKLIGNKEYYSKTFKSKIALLMGRK